MSDQPTTKIEQSIRHRHKQKAEQFEDLEVEISKLFAEACQKRRWLFISRVKAEESYALKLLTGRYSDYSIDDFLACTIVVPSLRHIAQAEELVLTSLDVLERKPGELTNLGPSDFRFDGIRMNCELKRAHERRDLVEANLCFEIQVKTMLEYACDEATHDFSYKATEVSWAKQRLAAQIKALLNNVDLSILEMEQISASPFLSKTHLEFEKLNEVIDFIKEEFGVKAGVFLPKDMKRLAEQLLRVLVRAEINLATLKIDLDKETEAGKGYNITNLSIYSICLQALLARHKSVLVKALCSKPKRRGPPIVLPKELEIETIIPDTSQLKHVTLLG